MSLDTRAIESLLSFWAASGVEALYEESRVNRMVRPVAPTSPDTRPGKAVANPANKPPAPPTTVTPPPIPAELAALSAARAAANASTDLDSLKTAIAAFEGCPLKSGAKQAVFSRGPVDAPIMLIGEAPGADEDAQGAPFVGRAGQLLDRMLSAAGLSDRIFITNTVFWRPPGNRTPTAAEQDVCRPFVERAIALVRPRFLLLVGGASAKAMLKTSDGILSIRGRWSDWKSDDQAINLPALPTLHPSFLLRQPAAKRKSWEDLLLLVDRMAKDERGA